MYKTMDYPICEEKKILGGWKVKYDNILESKQLSDRTFLNIKSRNLCPNSDNRYHNLMMTPDGWFKNQLDFNKKKCKYSRQFFCIYSS